MLLGHTAPIQYGHLQTASVCCLCIMTKLRCSHGALFMATCSLSWNGMHFFFTKSRGGACVAGWLLMPLSHLPPPPPVYLGSFILLLQQVTSNMRRSITQVAITQLGFFFHGFCFIVALSLYRGCWFSLGLVAARGEVSCCWALTRAAGSNADADTTDNSMTIRAEAAVSSRSLLACSVATACSIGCLPSL